MGLSQHLYPPSGHGAGKETADPTPFAQAASAQLFDAELTDAQTSAESLAAAWAKEAA